MRRFVLVALMVLWAAPAEAQNALGAKVDSILAQSPWDRAYWGVLAVDAATGRALVERNADRLFVPASNLKLVVSATAAHHLDPAFTYTTAFGAAGPIEAGVLRGDLVVRGTGDPTISGRYADSLTAVVHVMVDSLVAHGITRIDGGIIADDTHWDAQLVRGDWESYDLLWWYAAPVSPLGFNDNSIDFRVAPGRAGQPVQITWQPETSYFTFVNRTTTVGAGGGYTLDFDRITGTDTIFAYGEMPVDADVRTEYFAVADPADYLATVLRETLERRGIEVMVDPPRVVRRPASPPESSPIFELRSPSLERIIGPILGTSQNWFAEQLLKTVGREVRGEGSWSAGLAVESEFLRDVVGIDATAFRLRDASGLSSANLITPRALVRLVSYVLDEPRQEVVRKALPVSAAATGSLRNRFTDLPGQVHAKTGSIANVASLSGFVTTANGRTIVFSIVANATGTSHARAAEAIDAIVRLLAAS